MVDARSRARVLRMVAGDFRPDDLTHLFLFARDRCDGRETIREIGDFVAHHAERTKGIVTRSTRDWFAIAHYISWRFRPSNMDENKKLKPLTGKNLPSFFPDYLRATLRRMDHKTVRKKCGLSGSRSVALLERVIAKLTRDSDGTYHQSAPLEDKEHALVEMLCSVLVVKSAFSGDRLHDEFVATLRSNGLISPAELAASPMLATVVPLFAAAVMHNSSVVMDDGSRVVLKAGPFDNDEISVMATIQPPEPPPFAAAIYRSGFVATDFCEAQLLDLDSWDVEVELKANGKLGVM